MHHQRPSQIEAAGMGLQSMLKGLFPSVGSHQDADSGTVKGNFNFDFSLKLEGNTGLSNNGILVASGNERLGVSGNELPLGLRCTWRRRLQGPNIVIDIPGISTNMYQLSADDIGCSIQVEASLADPNNESYFGAAIGEIGPFGLDPSTRRLLDNAISSGTQRFPVVYHKPASSSDSASGTGDPMQNYMLHITQDEIKVVQPGMTERFDREMSFPFQADYPRVLIHPLDTMKFRVNFDSKTEMHFSSLSRQSRDLIALTIRCFTARRHISMDALLERIFANPANHGSGQKGHFEDNPENNILNLCIYTERLRAELTREVEATASIKSRYAKMAREKAFLDDQLHDTISGYTGVIQELQDQVISGGGGKYDSPQNYGGQRNDFDPFFQSGSVPLRKYESVQQENSTLKMEIEELKRLRLQEKHRAKANNPFGDTSADSHSVSQEVARLMNENKRLTNSTANQTGSEMVQNLQGELKRLRADNEKLTGERESLIHKLHRAHGEKQELSSNFSLIKSEYDKLQSFNAQGGYTQGGSSSSYFGGGSSQNVQQSQEYQHLYEERNRLARRVEQLSQDLEKGKTNENSSLERVMAGNAKLLEEKEKMQCEIERLQKLYSDTVSTLNNAGSGAGYGGGELLNSKLRQLQMETAQKDETIRRQESEIAQLKAKVRKLANA